MKSKKSILSLATAAMMLSGILTGCGTEPSVEPQESAQVEQSQPPQEPEVDTPAVQPDEIQDPDTTVGTGKAEVTTGTLWESDGLKIELVSTQFDEILRAETMTMKFCNDTDRDVLFKGKSIRANYFMGDILPMAMVPAHSQQELTTEVSTPEMSDGGIKKIGMIDCDFVVVDPSTQEELYYPTIPVIKTEHADDMDTELDDIGHEVWNKDGLSIYAKLVDESDEWGYKIMLYVENNTGGDLSFKTGRLVINDNINVTSMLFKDIDKNCRAYMTLPIMNSDVEGINTLENIQMDFSAQDKMNTHEVYGAELLKIPVVFD